MYREPPSDAPLVITAFKGAVIALRASDGHEQWRASVEGEMIRIHVTAERVIAVGGSSVAMFEYATGREQARISLSSGSWLSTTLMVIGDRAFVSRGGIVTCVDLGAGKVLWQNDLPGTGYGPAALGVPGWQVQGDGG